MLSLAAASSGSVPFHMTTDRRSGLEVQHGRRGQDKGRCQGVSCAGYGTPRRCWASCVRRQTLDARLLGQSPKDPRSRCEAARLRFKAVASHHLRSIRCCLPQPGDELAKGWFNLSFARPDQIICTFHNAGTTEGYDECLFRYLGVCEVGRKQGNT